MSRNGGPNNGALGAPRGALTSYDSTQERYIPFYQGDVGKRKATSNKGVGVGRPISHSNKGTTKPRRRGKHGPQMPEANINQSKVMNK